MSKALSEVVAAIERIAPLELAEDWDNVGVLIDALDDGDVDRCLLAIDLTENVLDEAIANGHGLVIAYHPPIFGALSRLRADVPSERVVLRAIRHGIAVHSPHTALDATAGGVNDWLADGLGEGSRTCIATREGIADPRVGQGRRVELDRPLPLPEIVARIKAHLGLDRVRVAPARRHDSGEPLHSVALCAGAGGSVIGPVAADVHWTGEMRHHDVLAAVARGTSVVLCEHSNTERGYLPVLRQRLLDDLGDAITIDIARTDREPLEFA